ncbi:hypothetical protein TraAM80_05529 [Trypanosoma rangeli]|uniref:Uncharacterized protein n=1 Tax=Trypanosoma rangeli TaxID=5698 RepID=A0A3R7KCM5_TRYRA|nr:uncharacterized protein TraAM80_05529 [Trypanosoma rangeli]RNF03834.1 hypothetical protein TraAM80_05529 [Trypanosoma rangeli]|eukprot:RNF03834.1 hypothetical protein TraAM80_05529 [Trypanosoma rangeli]
MLGLTEEDITEEAIHIEEARLRSATLTVTQLQEQLASLQAKLRLAEEECTRLANSLRWRRMMAEVEQDDELTGITAAMTTALNRFYASLHPPADYDEVKEEVPYVDTDDYADFSPIEALFDDCLAVVLELLSEEGDSAPGSREGRHRRAMLMLLVLTVNLGRLFESAEMAEAREEAEELRENVTSVWQHLLYSDGGLTPLEKAEWKEVVQTFLGAPYDIPAC